jgi:uncharacterized protein
MTTTTDAVRAGYAAFATGDLAVLDALFADDVVWHTTGRSPLAGTYKGKEQLFGGFFGGLAEQSGGTFTAEIESLFAENDHVVVLVRHRGERKGRTLDTQDVVVFRFAGDRVADVRVTSFDPYETDAFWA